MAYDLRLRPRPDGLEVTRSPGAVPRTLGFAFQAVGALFLLALPLAVTEAGGAGVLGAVLAAGLGLGIGDLLRKVRRVVRADRSGRRLSCGWYRGSWALPLDRHELTVSPGTRLVGKRVRAHSEHGTRWLWAVQAIQPGRGKPVALIHTDKPQQADQVLAALADALGIRHEPVPPAER